MAIETSVEDILNCIWCHWEIIQWLVTQEPELVVSKMLAPDEDASAAEVYRCLRHGLTLRALGARFTAFEAARELACGHDKLDRPDSQQQFLRLFPSDDCLWTAQAIMWWESGSSASSLPLFFPLAYLTTHEWQRKTLVSDLEVVKAKLLKLKNVQTFVEESRQWLDCCQSLYNKRAEVPFDVWKPEDPTSISFWPFLQLLPFSHQRLLATLFALGIPEIGPGVDATGGVPMSLFESVAHEQRRWTSCGTIATIHMEELPVTQELFRELQDRHRLKQRMKDLFPIVITSVTPQGETFCLQTDCRDDVQHFLRGQGVLWTRARHDALTIVTHVIPPTVNYESERHLHVARKFRGQLLHVHKLAGSDRSFYQDLVESLLTLAAASDVKDQDRLLSLAGKYVMNYDTWLQVSLAYAWVLLSRQQVDDAKLLVERVLGVEDNKDITTSPTTRAYALVGELRALLLTCLVILGQLDKADKAYQESLRFGAFSETPAGQIAGAAQDVARANMHRARGEEDLAISYIESCLATRHCRNAILVEAICVWAKLRTKRDLDAIIAKIRSLLAARMFSALEKVKLQIILIESQLCQGNTDFTTIRAAQETMSEVDSDRLEYKALQLRLKRANKGISAFSIEL